MQEVRIGAERRGEGPLIALHVTYTVGAEVRSRAHRMSPQAQARKETNCLLTLAQRTQHYRNVLRTVEVLSLALFLRKKTRGSMVHTWSRVLPELRCITNVPAKTPAV
jgi:hypothetical protein